MREPRSPWTPNPGAKIMKPTPALQTAIQDMETIVIRLRVLSNRVQTYRKDALYESLAALHLDLAMCMEASWREFESILEDLPE